MDVDYGDEEYVVEKVIHWICFTPLDASQTLAVLQWAPYEAEIDGVIVLILSMLTVILASDMPDLLLSVYNTRSRTDVSGEPGIVYSSLEMFINDDGSRIDGWQLVDDRMLLAEALYKPPSPSLDVISMDFSSEEIVDDIHHVEESQVVVDVAEMKSAEQDEAKQLLDLKNRWATFFSSSFAAPTDSAALRLIPKLLTIEVQESNVIAVCTVHRSLTNARRGVFVLPVLRNDVGDLSDNVAKVFGRDCSAIKKHFVMEEASHVKAANAMEGGGANMLTGAELRIVERSSRAGPMTALTFISSVRRKSLFLQCCAACLRGRWCSLVILVRRAARYDWKEGLCE